MPGRPQIGIGMLITKDDQVLLVKRGNAPGDAVWAPPAGRVEYGKSLEESVIHASHKQIGALITDITFLAITNDIFEEQKKHAITIWMAAHFVSSEPAMHAAHAISTTGWFSWDALPDPLFSPFEHLLTGRCYPALWDFSGGAKLP